MGVEPATYREGGALTCEPREPWGATSLIHRPGCFQTRGLFAVEFRVADPAGLPGWLLALSVPNEPASVSPEETGGTCRLSHFRCRGSAREPETQRGCAP